MLDYMALYEVERARLATCHETGAHDALADAVEADVKCGTYCYGGSVRVDVADTLANLAEQGWRLVRA